MDLITIDFETYYDRDFSLSKITTEEYIRSDLFEVIGVGVKINNQETEWASGTNEQIREWLQSNFEWERGFVLAHNTLFDGAILSWRFGINPRGWLDTLCMGRALHGVEVGGSLKALTERYGLGEKGTEVVNALGKRRLSFSDAELAQYGDYCINDVELTYKLFNILSKDFPKQELRVIDQTLRMFIDPVLELDGDMLQQHLISIKQMKEDLLTSSGVDKAELMSNEKFAELLRSFGVEPPMKVSPATGKQTYAFAKSDEEFKALADYEDVRVQTLVAARLGTKSTLEETRTQRFIDISKRGNLPVPIRYYAAHTGRFGGDDKINMQNLPSRGNNANKLKKSIIAPDGYTIIDADSAQIEARVLAWLSEQDDLVTAFAEGKDVYKKMASAIYGKPEFEITKDERFVGKTTILGAGYGMGAVKFQAQLKNMGVDVDTDEARRIIDIYRRTNDAVVRLWRQAQNALVNMSRGEPVTSRYAGECLKWHPSEISHPLALGSADALRRLEV
jgi:DNA polymerase I-like protein with 3'-5' exonuclease and polymerase domains